MNLKDDLRTSNQCEEFKERCLEVSYSIINYYDGSHLDTNKYIQSIIRDFKTYFKSMLYNIEEVNENMDSKINILVKGKDPKLSNYRLKIPKNRKGVFYLNEESEDLSLKTENMFCIKAAYEDDDMQAEKDMGKLLRDLKSINNYTNTDNLKEANEKLEVFLAKFNEMKDSQALIFKISTPESDKLFNNFRDVLVEIFKS